MKNLHLRFHWSSSLLFPPPEFFWSLSLEPATVLGIVNRRKNKMHLYVEEFPRNSHVLFNSQWTFYQFHSDNCRHIFKSTLSTGKILFFSQLNLGFPSLFRMITFTWILPVIETRTLWSYRTKSGRNSSRNTLTRLLTTLHTPASGVRVATI